MKSSDLNWESVVSKDKGEPVQRHEAAFVRVGEKFYLLGGRSIRPVSIFTIRSLELGRWAQNLLLLKYSN